MKIGGIKHGGKIGKLKYDNNYVLVNKGDTFQEKILKMFNENLENVSTSIIELTSIDKSSHEEAIVI